MSETSSTTQQPSREPDEGSRKATTGAGDRRAGKDTSDRKVLVPLALAQFIASYDSSSMNVAITNIAADLDTTVTGVQTALTLFTLMMAAFMIPGSRLSDRWGRKRCFRLGITVYATGALITSLAPAYAFLVLGWSILEGLGSALMIPPIYILLTVRFDDIAQRAKAFGVVSAMGGIGAASGPLIGGAFTTAISWRASFAAEVVVCILILLMSRRIVDPKPERATTKFDIGGTLLSALGLVLIVSGLLASRTYGWTAARTDVIIGSTVLIPEGGLSPVWILIGAGIAGLAAFVWWEKRLERKGREVLIPMRLFGYGASNFGLITQNIQWFMMIGLFFVISVFLQTGQGYSAVRTGLLLTPATAGLLISSFLAARLARRRPQRTLIVSGFVLAELGIILLLLLVRADSPPLDLAPGLLLFGLGAGVMVTASVNVVQSALPESDQGSISGVSRSVSNLGSSLGTAIAGSVLVAGIIFGVTRSSEESTVLDDQAKQQIEARMDEGDVSALSDVQVREVLAGQPEETIEEVVRINAMARNRSLAAALIAIGIGGLIGLFAALRLPRSTGKAGAAPA